jgi:YcxB-like protein
MTLQYEQTREDATAACAMMTGKIKWYLIILWFLVVMLNFSGVLASIREGDTAGASARMLPAIFLGVFFLFLAWLQPRLAARKIILRPIDWRLSDEGVQIRTSVAATDIRWEAYLKYKEGKKVFLLYVQKGQAQFIPKRVLSESETVELRNLISAHVKKA